MDGGSRYGKDTNRQLFHEREPANAHRNIEERTSNVLGPARTLVESEPGREGDRVVIWDLAGFASRGVV